MAMYNASLSDRIKVQAEIFCEGCCDFISRNSLRRPLMILAGVAFVMTVKNGRQSVYMIKNSAYSPFRSKWGSSQFSPYGSSYGSSSYGSSYGSSSYGSPYGGTSGQYGATGSASYGGAASSSYGGAATPSYGASSYGSSASYGASPTAQYPQARAATTTGFGLRGGASAAATFSTQALYAQHGSSVQAVQGGLFHDFGMTTSFMGQIETVSAIAAPMFLDQILRTPGAGKVLVVDGGGGMNGATLDSTMVRSALQAGWKGIILHGAVLDAAALKTLSFGVKAVGANPMRGQQSMGQRGIPLSFGGVNFSPGSYVYADKDGILVSQMNLVSSTTTRSAVNTAATRGYTSGGAAAYPSTTGSTSSYTGARTAGAVGGTAMASGGYATPGAVRPAGSTMGSTYGTNTPPAQPYGASAMGMGAQQRPAASYGSSYQSQQYGGGSSYGASSPYGQTFGYPRKRPNKKKLIGVLILISGVAWFCLSD